MTNSQKKEPKPSLLNVNLIKGVIKSFLGDISFKADREKQLVTIRAKGQEHTLTYDQLLDEIEAIFQDE